MKMGHLYVLFFLTNEGVRFYVGTTRQEPHRRWGKNGTKYRTQSKKFSEMWSDKTPPYLMFALVWRFDCVFIARQVERIINALFKDDPKSLNTYL
jgi:hypothetical protein